MASSAFHIVRLFLIEGWFQRNLDPKLKHSNVTHFQAFTRKCFLIVVVLDKEKMIHPSLSLACVPRPQMFERVTDQVLDWSTDNG